MKKISVNTVKAFVKEYKKETTASVTFTVGEGSFDVTFRASLSVDEKSTFIRRVVSGCFDAAGNYRPEYFTPVLRATMLQMCTDLPPLTMKNETGENGGAVLDLDGMNELYDVLRDIWMVGEPDNTRAVMKKWNALVEEMKMLCEVAVQWRKERLRADAGVDAALRRLLDTLTDKAEGVDSAQMMEYAGKLARVMEETDVNAVLDAVGKREGYVPVNDAKAE